MESSSSLILKTLNNKRFVIEDSITKVTSDGKPHEMMTMIAAISGLLAAVVILTVLIFLVACKKTKNHECDKCSEIGSTTGTTTTDSMETQSKCSSTAAIIYNPKQLEGRSISVICGRDNVDHHKSNFQSNLNKAFESSELDLNLQSSLKTPKPKKTTHWQDEKQEKEETRREIFIQMERY